ncbi:cytosine permease [Pseudarthrobacter sp. NamE5]|uniref:purine-cytosine permease family protein n=1 Tax=Pseudarthrobacter sp. NamE5 TaxID=2576839 RepID=UPI00110B93E5|nr:cytosine permease [Pseudarthrobacter sp. NamE5]TLM88237.1 cytosine permease [Pseudarthrobacter sp. NamE5]
MAQSKLEVEKYSTDFVPHSERYGKARNLFSLWFATNMNVLTVATGAIPVALGLPVVWAVVAAIVGHAVGAVFMALHSAQGPILGIPQMIQSRAQFGYLGSILPLVLVVIMYIGYFAVGGVLTGNALAEWLGWDVNISIAIANALATVVTIYGYRLIRASVTVVSWVTGIAFVILTMGLVTRNDLAGALPQGEFTWGLFFLAVTLAATWQLTYAPYVADYSRYLPAHTSVRASFWWTYAGSAASSTWMFAFGAIATAVAADAFAGGSVSFIAAQAGFAPWLFLVLILLGNIVILGVDLYGGFMSVVTITGALKASTGVRPSTRVITVLGISAVGTVLAIAGRGDFLNTLMNFIVLLAVFLVPWTSINLIDFYLVRKEKYDIPAIYDPAGRYRGVDWRAMTAYAVAVVSEVPFLVTPLFTGPLAESFDGVDVSWVVGLVVSAALFYILMKRYPRRHGFLPIPETASEADECTPEELAGSATGTE